MIDYSAVPIGPINNLIPSIAPLLCVLLVILLILFVVLERKRKIEKRLIAKTKVEEEDIRRLFLSINNRLDECLRIGTYLLHPKGSSSFIAGDYAVKVVYLKEKLILTAKLKGRNMLEIVFLRTMGTFARISTTTIEKNGISKPEIVAVLEKVKKIASLPNYVAGQRK